MDTQDNVAPSTNLDDPRVDKLAEFVKNSFRVRKNSKHFYIDIGGNQARVLSPQHQVVFGRRGSGKSSLLVDSYFKSIEQQQGAVFIDCDEVKTLGYPDILIRLLLEVLKGVVRSTRFRASLSVRSGRRQLKLSIRELEDLLDDANVASVTANTQTSSGIQVDINAISQYVAGKIDRSQLMGEVSEYTRAKLDYLERHLIDYKREIERALPSSRDGKSYFVFVDDLYLIPSAHQPLVLDYLHRLLRGTNAYFKVGTVEHRTSLHSPGVHTVGVVPEQDVETIRLDRTFEDLQSTRAFLKQMLDTIGDRVGITSASTALLNRDALHNLVLASGGVPRDFLSVFVEARTRAIADGKSVRHITPTHVWKAASGLLLQSKTSELEVEARGDAPWLLRVFEDIKSVVINERKTTAFLVSHERAREYPDAHEAIEQLMDFKLLHLIDSATSAASSRPGHYRAYSLDFSLFMEPRRRNIDVVEFWEMDEQRHRKGVRGAPSYDPARVPIGT